MLIHTIGREANVELNRFFRYHSAAQKVLRVCLPSLPDPGNALHSNLLHLRMYSFNNVLLMCKLFFQSNGGGAGNPIRSPAGLAVLSGVLVLAVISCECAYFGRS
jgi:hypothetical protein